MLSDPSSLDRFGAMIAGVGAAAAIQLGCGGVGLLLDRLRGAGAMRPQ